MITKKCRDCGKEFTLSDGEIDFFRSKGFDLPNRCQSCRNKRKKKNASPEVRRSVNKQNHSGKQISALTIPVLIIAVGLLLCYLIFIGSDILPANPSSTADITDSSVFIFEEITAAETPYTVTAEESIGTTEKASETAAELITEPTHAVTSAEAVNTSPETVLETSAIIAEESSNTTVPSQTRELHFRNEELLSEHYENHGIEMGFSSAQDYERAAAAVVSSPKALHKLEKEDNDDVYYLESTNEFVIVSTDGYIRTYFKPDKGKAYFDKQ